LVVKFVRHFAVTSGEAVVQCDWISGFAACHDLSVCY
jgi:hypothetical protein